MTFSDKSQTGFATIEYLISFPLVFISFLFVLEIIRLSAYKTQMQILSNTQARLIAYRQIELMEKGIVPKNEMILNVEKNVLIDDIKKNMSDQLDKNQMQLISFDQFDGSKQGVLKTKHSEIDVSIKIVTTKKIKNNLRPGVYVKVTSCLPVLFSGYFRHFFNDQKINVGKSVGKETENRTCLGQFSGSSIEPFFWFRVRTASYAPWPASTGIYLKGYAQPDQLFGLEDKYRKEISDFVLNETHFSSLNGRNKKWPAQ